MAACLPGYTTPYAICQYSLIFSPVTADRLYLSAIWQTYSRSLPLGMIFLAVILALAASLRLYRLGDIPNGLFWDEISAVYTPYLYQVGVTDLPIKGVIVYLMTGTYPIYSLFGPSTFFSRLPEVIFGVGLVFVVYLLAKNMFSRRVGLISALLVAVTPWAVHFSRFQAFNSAYVFFFTLGLLFLYWSIREANSRKKRLIWISLSAAALALSANIVSSGHIFVPLFIAGFALVNFVKKPRGVANSLLEKAVFAGIFLLLYSPIIGQFLSMDFTSVRAITYSTFYQSSNPFEVAGLFFNRALMHLSPDFLVYIEPSPHDLPFQQTMARSGQIVNSPTAFGELNYVGILVYPGILFLLYQGIRGRSRESLTIMVWIICYAIVSGIAYYDNPNPARNIVGMPALIITVALTIDLIIRTSTRFFVRNGRREGEERSDRGYEKEDGGSSHKSNVRSIIATVLPAQDVRALIIIGGLSCLILIPTILFLNEYYGKKYEQESAKAFDYGYREAAQFLSDNNLWGERIYLNESPDRYQMLAFYSGKKYPPSIITVADLNALNPDAFNVKPQNRFVSISKDVLFTEGTIRYDVRLDEMYDGGASSSHIVLSDRQGNKLALAIYSDESTFSPGTYLLSQQVSGLGYSEQESKQDASGISNYQDWHTVQMDIDTETVALYLDDRFVSSWERPSGDSYSTISLAAESSSASFRDLTVTSKESAGGTAVTTAATSNNILKDDDDGGGGGRWQVSSGKMIKSGSGGEFYTVSLMPPAASESILITRSPYDHTSSILSRFNVDYSRAKEVRYPDGTVAFTILKLSSPSPVQSVAETGADAAAATATVPAQPLRPSSPSPPTSTNSTLTVRSATADGTDLSGMWTSIARLDGSVVQTGFTPFTITLPNGEYQIGAGDFDVYNFAYWADNGSTVEPRIITLDGSTTLTAVYE